jgi:Acetylornithine deacetylase/Succinyl-diaminopimelate desuccinylase and related deacylases
MLFPRHNRRIKIGVVAKAARNAAAGFRQTCRAGGGPMDVRDEILTASMGGRTSGSNFWATWCAGRARTRRRHAGGRRLSDRVPRGQGHPHEVIEPKPGMVNVVAATDRGPGRSVILNGHLDTFPVGDRSGWERDPFSGEVGRRQGLRPRRRRHEGGDGGVAHCLLPPLRAA